MNPILPPRAVTCLARGFAAFDIGQFPGSALGYTLTFDERERAKRDLELNYQVYELILRERLRWEEENLPLADEIVDGNSTDG